MAAAACRRRRAADAAIVLLLGLAALAAVATATAGVPAPLVQHGDAARRACQLSPQAAVYLGDHASDASREFPVPADADLATCVEARYNYTSAADLVFRIDSVRSATNDSDVSVIVDLAVGAATNVTETFVVTPADVPLTRTVRVQQPLSVFAVLTSGTSEVGVATIKFYVQTPRTSRASRGAAAEGWGS